MAFKWIGDKKKKASDKKQFFRKNIKLIFQAFWNLSQEPGKSPYILTSAMSP